MGEYIKIDELSKIMAEVLDLLISKKLTLLEQEYVIKMLNRVIDANNNFVGLKSVSMARQQIKEFEDKSKGL